MVDKVKIKLLYVVFKLKVKVLFVLIWVCIFVVVEGIIEFGVIVVIIIKLIWLVE